MFHRKSGNSPHSGSEQPESPCSQVETHVRNKKSVDNRIQPADISEAGGYPKISAERAKKFLGQLKGVAI
jgi:hypothetical protein